MKNHGKKVAIALSGGIDSLVAGYLLKKDYPDLFGICFTTGYEKRKPDLSPIARKLDIAIHHVDLSETFNNRVVKYFIGTYMKGRTPNPCIECNKAIKFRALLHAAQSFGADTIATGHYAVIREQNSTYTLLKGKDHLKDQSYFLSKLSTRDLKNIIFPLGNKTKEEVKNYARKKGLIPVEKKESQDICFLKNQTIPDFILSKTNEKSRPGTIINHENRVIGTHQGLLNFTIGQRRGINCPASEPYYVKKIDCENNTLIVCFKDQLFNRSFSVNLLHLLMDNINSPLRVNTKIRYNHRGAASVLTLRGTDHADIEFDKEQFAITPGQTAVFYLDNRVIGSGTII